MGASNPHPHGQIWATDSLGTIAAREDQQQRAYHDRYGTVLLQDYAWQEGGNRRSLRTGKRELAGRRALLGGLALRDAAAAQVIPASGCAT